MTKGSCKQFFNVSSLTVSLRCTNQSIKYLVNLDIKDFSGPKRTIKGIPPSTYFSFEGGQGYVQCTLRIVPLHVIRFCMVVNKGRKVYASKCVRMRSLQDNSIVTLTYFGEKRGKNPWHMSKFWVGRKGEKTIGICPKFL